MLDQEENNEPTFEDTEQTPYEKSLIEDIEKIDSQIADLIELKDTLGEKLVNSIVHRRNK